MLKIESLSADKPALQFRSWPPVPVFNGFSSDLENFLNLTVKEKITYLKNLEQDSEALGAFTNSALSTIYGYVYSYADSPCYLQSNTLLECQLQEAKIFLEDALINKWLPLVQVPDLNSQEELANYLRIFVKTNPGVGHEFWDYIRDEATLPAIREFLRLVLCRNEVVDDECAFLVVGLQGNMKKVMVSNLWDECGNGSLNKFHTYWLRRLLEQTNDWEDLIDYRAENKKPWVSGILSNVFNVFLTRPHYKFRAYGFFTTTESWVEPHFIRILQGLNRVKLDHDDIAIYFKAHINIDPQHSNELLEAIACQSPVLTVAEIKEVLIGAHQSVFAAQIQYRTVMAYLRTIDAQQISSHD